MLPSSRASKKPIYLDYAATTPVDPRVQKVMAPFLAQTFGNPLSLYKQGRQAATALSEARKTIAGLINARSEEIIFTAGGTESINLAVLGAARRYSTTKKFRPHLITSAIEHDAVLQSFAALEREGCKITRIGVDGDGFIKMEELKAAVRPETVFISLMYANNEIGTVEPVAEVGKWVRHINQERTRRALPRRSRTTVALPQIIFHTDACQAAGSLDLDVNRLGVDLMSVNGSKIYGPKQTGFLYVRNGLSLAPIIYGGGQEQNLRSGTQNVAGAAGLAEALRLAQAGRQKENLRLSKLRDYCMHKIGKAIPDVILNGPQGGPYNRYDQKNFQLRRLPNNLNFCIQGLEGEALMLYLDSYNIAVSTGSACSSANSDPSHVLLAIGRTAAQAQGSVRLTLGHMTQKKDLDYLLKILPPLVRELQKVNTF